jgi:signal transduction histidine kinase
MDKRNLYAFLISFILLLAVIILNRLSFNNVRAYSDEVDHTRQVITVLGNISNHFKSAQIYTPSYGHVLQEDYYKLYEAEAKGIRGELDSLRILVSDNRAQVMMVDSLSSLIMAEMDTLLEKSIVDIINTNQGWRLYKYFVIHDMINKAILTEESLLIERKSKLNDSTATNNLLTTAFGVIGVGILLYTFISVFFLSKKSRWLEGFLESILDTSQNGIVHYKAIRENGKVVDFRIEFINRSFDQLLETDPRQLLGKRLSEFPSQLRETALFEKYVKVVETGKPEEFESFYQRGHTGRWFSISLAKLQDGVTASFHNISELKKYEEELKENIRELERSNKELEQYAYAASHDLQEPLRKIRSFGSYLEDTQSDRLDEKGKLQLKKIIDSAERMSILIKDILGFSGIRKEELLVPTDLNKVVAAILDDLDLVITQKKANITTERLPVIDAIPLQMNQLFYNLINNSIKFAKEGRKPLVHITCRLLPEIEKGDHLPSQITYFEIGIHDNGIGFNQDYVDQIFGLFKRLNDKQFYPGSGIGLALCRKVVENHHGEIRAEGREGEGASFYVRLPARQP